MTHKTFIAIESGCVEVDGEPLVFVKGKTLVEEGHPLLDQVPDYFVDSTREIHYEAPTQDLEDPTRETETESKPTRRTRQT